MKINTVPFKEWFGYSRRERRSTFILLFIILLIISIRYTFPESSIEIEEIADSVSGLNLSSGNGYSTTKGSDSLFRFDPNIASFDSLIHLGLSSREAGALISYRKKGGRFKKPNDIKKVYGIDSTKAGKLIPYISIVQDTSQKTFRRPYQKKMSLLELNSCDTALLVRLPGIGPVLSSRIVKYRHLIGGFARIEQLKEVYGLPVETFENIKGRFTVDTLMITKININSAEYKVLARLPYLEKYEVTGILKYRELKGKLTGIADLIDNNLLTAEKAQKVRPYLRFE